MSMKRYMVLVMVMVLILASLLPMVAFMCTVEKEKELPDTEAEPLALQEINPSTYVFVSLGGDEIEIGSERHSPPQPYLNLSKWDGEVYLRVNVPYVEAEVPEFFNNRLKWTTRKYGVEFYPKEPEEISGVIAGKEFWFRQNEEGGVEFDLVLKEKPDTNVFRFPIQSKGLRFYYQPPLHPEHPTWADTDGDSVPDVFTSENVVGSFAVYHETQAKLWKTREEAEKYRTGKAFHIYRPKVSDAEGKEIWGELNIDEEEGVLTVTIDPDWLDNAVYPVTIDPKFGYESVGSHYGDLMNDVIKGSWFTCPEDGTAESLSMYIQNGWTDEQVKGAIYKKSDNSLVGSTEEKTISGTPSWTPAWYTFNFLGSPSLSAGEDYFLVGWANKNTSGSFKSIYYDEVTEEKAGYQSKTYGAWPDPWSPTLYKYRFSIYCTYTTQPSSTPSSESSSTGSFDLENAAPAVTDFTLYESDESGMTTQMTPQTEYAVKIEVSDANKLEDIAQLKVILKTNTTPLTAGDNVTDKATYKWTASNGWEFVGPGAGGSTWAINASACRQPSDFTATSGTWWLHFVPGKVARESTAATTQRWDIYVKAMDKQSASDEMIKWDYEMMWYGELSAVDTSYEFGDVQLGAENVTITDSDTAINVTTIANGNYKLESKSTDWVNTTFGSTAMLDWDSTLSSGEFALKVDGYGSLDSFTYVRDTYTTIQDFSSVSGPTAEAGENRGIYQWLSVASEGLLPGTYKGTYYVQIANG